MEQTVNTTALEQWFSHFSTVRIPGGLVQTQFARPHSPVSDSVNLGWSLRTGNCNKCSSDAGPFETTLKTTV